MGSEVNGETGLTGASRTHDDNELIFLLGFVINGESNVRLVIVMVTGNNGGVHERARPTGFIASGVMGNEKVKREERGVQILKAEE